MRAYRLEHAETRAGMFRAGIAPDEWGHLIPAPWRDTDCGTDYCRGLFGFTERQVRAMFRKSVRILAGTHKVEGAWFHRDLWRTFMDNGAVVVYQVPRADVIVNTHHQVVFLARHAERVEERPVTHYLRREWVKPKPRPAASTMSTMRHAIGARDPDKPIRIAV